MCLGGGHLSSGARCRRLGWRVLELSAAGVVVVIVVGEEVDLAEADFREVVHKCELTGATPDVVSPSCT